MVDLRQTAVIFRFSRAEFMISAGNEVPLSAELRQLSRPDRG